MQLKKLYGSASRIDWALALATVKSQVRFIIAPVYAENPCGSCGSSSSPRSFSSQLGALSAEDLSAVPYVEEPAREPPMPKVRFRAVQNGLVRFRTVIGWSELFWTALKWLLRLQVVANGYTHQGSVLIN